MCDDCLVSYLLWFRHSCVVFPFFLLVSWGRKHIVWVQALLFLLSLLDVWALWAKSFLLILVSYFLTFYLFKSPNSHGKCALVWFCVLDINTCIVYLKGILFFTYIFLLRQYEYIIFIFCHLGAQSQALLPNCITYFTSMFSLNLSREEWEWGSKTVQWEMLYVYTTLFFPYSPFFFFLLSFFFF